MNKQIFKMPNPVKITGRSSSITNSFVNGIIPIIEPTENEINEALAILGMNQNTICCAYCGDKHTEWDHLRPLIIDKTATGYISEIHNLVPACGKCNQSKGNKNWKTWMFSSAEKSPKTRNIADIEQRCQRLSDFENWGTPIKIDIESIIGKEKWDAHWKNCDKIIQLMKESQSLSNEIKSELKDALVLNPNKEKKHTTHILKQVSTKPESNKPIGQIVQTEFVQLLQSNLIDNSTIDFLQRNDYSNQIFGVNFPVLIRIDSINDTEKGIDYKGRRRYYATPIQINSNWYLLTSQWYEHNKSNLIKWINKYNKKELTN